MDSSSLHGTCDRGGATPQATGKAKLHVYKGLGNEYDFVSFSVEILDSWGTY